MSNLQRHKDCKMRSEIGNCLAMGGFCTSVSKEICEGLQNAYTNGKRSIEVSKDCENCKHENEPPFGTICGSCTKANSENYEPKVSEDAVRCYGFLKERIGSEITDNAEEFEKWFERMVWHVQKCNEYDTEMRNVIPSSPLISSDSLGDCNSCGNVGTATCNSCTNGSRYIKGQDCGWR